MNHLEAVRTSVAELKRSRKGVRDGATREQLKMVEKNLGAAVPADLAEVLRLTCGFEAAYPLDLIGRGATCGPSELYPHAIDILEDGFGNGWVLDVGEGSRVLFQCHDPPVLLFQSESLAEFVCRVIAMELGRTSPLETMDQQIRAFIEVGPGAIVTTTGAEKRTTVLRPGERATVDLRRASIGDGFWWAGSDVDVIGKRVGEGPVFEVWRERV